MRQDALVKGLLVLILIALVANLGVSLFKVDEAKAQLRADKSQDQVRRTSEAVALREVATAIQGLARSMDNIASAIERSGGYTKDISQANYAIAESIRASAAQVSATRTGQGVSR